VRAQRGGGRTESEELLAAELTAWQGLVRGAAQARPGNVADCGIPESRSVDIGLCPMRDPSRPGVGGPLRYLLWDASGSEH